jgi:hypothetical protein
VPLRYHTGIPDFENLPNAIGEMIHATITPQTGTAGTGDVELVLPQRRLKTKKELQELDCPVAFQ